MEKIGNFVFCNNLGVSSFGKVVSVQETTTGKKFAIKSMPITSENSKSILNELEFMCNKSLINPFLIKYHIMFTERNCAHLVMEYCSNGDLIKFLEKKQGRLDEKNVIDIFTQIVEGVYVLHREKVLHRDIKPGNILVNEFGEIKISDFGIAKVLNEMTKAQMTQTIGTIGFVPAEVYEGHVFSEASDMFAVGCVMYYVMTGTSPFAASTMHGILGRIFKGTYAPIAGGRYSKALKTLVYSLLNQDPARRPTATQLKNHQLIHAAFVGLPPRTPVPEPSELLSAEVEYPVVLLPAVAPAGAVYEGNRVSHTAPCDYVVSVEHDLAPGKIYSLDLVLKDSIVIGVALKSNFPQQHTRGAWFTPGIFAISGGGTVTLGDYYWEGPALWSPAIPTLVTLELDTALPQHTLRLFVGGLPTWIALAGVPSDVCFFAAGCFAAGSVMFRALRSVSHTQADTSLQVSVLKWNDD